MKEPKKNYEIAKALVLSTAHLRYQTSLAMDQMPVGEGYADTVRYGYQVPVSKEAANREGMPEEVEAACKLALELGCTLLRYDADAKTYEDLPTFEW
jgi:hypothetical protein